MVTLRIHVIATNQYTNYYVLVSHIAVRSTVANLTRIEIVSWDEHLK